MELIRRQISYEPATVRYTGGTVPYGTMTADTFYMKVMLTQRYDDMGMFTDIEFTPKDKEGSNTSPDYTILINKLAGSGFTFPFMLGQQPATPTQPIDERLIRPTNKEVDDYWAYASKITGETNSKITLVTSYDKNNKYIAGFDVDKEVYTNYIGNTVNGVSRVTNLGQFANPTGGTPFTYAIDAENDVNIGTSNQSTGILYKELTGVTRTILGYTPLPFNPQSTPTKNKAKKFVTFEYTGEGWNMTNTSLSALTKEEYLFGITQPPEVQSDVFIDRGATTVFEKHLRLSEVESLEHLERYNNGFYRLVKQ